MTVLAREFAEQLRHELKTRGVHRPKDYVLFGSVVMRLHGLTDTIGDVDLFVTQRLYATLRDLPMWVEDYPRPGDPPLLETVIGDALRMHAFHAWPSRMREIDVPAAFAAAYPVAGLMCVPLEMVAQHKRSVQRALNRARDLCRRWEKHERDLRVIEAHLERPAGRSA